MYLYGASGHAKVVMDILEAQGMEVEGLVDDNPELAELMGIPVLHSAEGLSPLIISIGGNAIRKKIAEGLSCQFGKAVHPTAIVSSRAEIGCGSVVMQGAIVQTCVRVGCHCIINTGASVDHECVVGDYVHLSPHSTLCGNVCVGEGTWIGAGATVIQGVRIGRWSVVGAGTVVTKDIPDGVIAVGNKCHIIKEANMNMLKDVIGGGKNAALTLSNAEEARRGEAQGCNVMFCSVGRRGRLLRNFRESMCGCGEIVATDNSPVAPALYFADRRYIVPRITDEGYFGRILEICRENNVRAVTTLIDPEIELLAQHRDELLAEGILPLCPAAWSAHLCFDKYEMFKYLQSKGVRTVLTYNSLESFKEALRKGEVSLPVFMKPISGSGSVGAGRADTLEEVENRWNEGAFTYIIQELMTGGDCDADVYVDCISHKPVAAFSKRKIETRIGGASKTISFKDLKLFSFIEEVCSVLELNGPCDMDFFIKDGEYYLSEINPRFGGAYLHAYGAGVDFVKLILNNVHGIENKPQIGMYEEDVIMMMYDDVVIRRKDELVPGGSISFI